MPRRVSITIDDDAWRVIGELPRGSRSCVINEAIMDWSRAAARREAVAAMDALRDRVPPAGKGEIVRWVREGRDEVTGGSRDRGACPIRSAEARPSVTAPWPTRA